ncbi:hypothetical protein HFK83_20065 [Ralstonia pseudosolanacearum]|uniref:Uncharacterized protein n=1 Tax=Ralstonia solanacearum TaxID=305 RepID=A0A0S4UXJ1_RALSL|nr:hypothetical protein [Ralstonia pseudosolanacearum]MCK4124654.1 hypothetical protein [Ralstonia pseudosolanacearum]MCK4165182.1 hypothetical protein [Ralstonia pseudosolanacearum]OIN69355.1 hypothetical protein BL248_21505 [Ralstonia solanacearum]CUV27037.1 conserved protein of unknown function [Ralstonia solanacearum]
MESFEAQIVELMRGGNAYLVKNDRGNVVLMTENVGEHDRPLAGFKRIERIKHGADVPIAVPMPRVVLRNLRGRARLGCYAAWPRLCHR